MGEQRSRQPGPARATGDRTLTVCNPLERAGWPVHSSGLPRERAPAPANFTCILGMGGTMTSPMADDDAELARLRRECELYRRLLALGRCDEPEPFLREALALVVELT